MTLSHPQITAEESARASRHLIESRTSLLEAVAGLSDAQWHFKPAADRWSNAEILEHIVLIEQVVLQIVNNIAAAPPPPAGWNPSHMDEYIPNHVPLRSSKLPAPPHAHPTGRWTGPEALHHFEQIRRQTILLVTAPALRGHVVSHPVLGPWDGYHWLLAAAAHSARHTAQILEVKADLGFPR